jgi:hypothetical protein
LNTHLHFLKFDYAHTDVKCDTVKELFWDGNVFSVSLFSLVENLQRHKFGMKSDQISGSILNQLKRGLDCVCASL